ncbi:MAG: transcriptional regulator [Chloroflexi bacterium]|nr:transcriptional regulator [Chloroflexota bacterium]
MPGWNFLTNHGLVLTFIGGHPESTGLEIALAVGITERATRAILTDLETDGYIAREKIGRRNRYRIYTALTVPHRGNRAVTVGELLDLLWSERDLPAQQDERSAG